MGSNILNDVIDDLLQDNSLKEASLLLMSGESAGGLGVLMNANKLKLKFLSQAPELEFKVIIDSSWLLELPYSFLSKQENDNQNNLINKIFLNSIKFVNFIFALLEK